MSLRVGLAAVLFAPAAWADVIQLTPAADNTLYESASALSNGAGPAMFAGRNSGAVDSIRRALVLFDVSAIPAGSNITLVTLQMSNSAANVSNQAVSLHSALESWGEGSTVAPGNGGAGGPASGGDATWQHRFFNTTLWSAAGGAYGEDPTATTIVGGAGLWTWQSAQMASDVQSWLDNPGGNFGWAIIGNEGAANTAKRFATREEPNAALRPILTVEYTIVPAPAAMPVLGLLFCARRRRAKGLCR